MFSRVKATLIVAALPQQSTISVEKCANNEVKCCDNLQAVKDSQDSSTAGLIGLLLGIGANVGLDCDTINVIGIANPGAACNSQPVCCEKVNQNGLVNLGCNPIAVQA